MASTKMDNLEELFKHELVDLYDAEHQILEAMPLMIKAASSDKLKKGLDQHRKQTEQQVKRLEQVFKAINEEPKREKCVGMEGLLKEGQKLMNKKNIDPAVLDAGLIASAQKVEHYEISGYGTARAYARVLGQDKVVELLTQTLEEESAADEKLTQLAESHVNQQAMS